MTHRTDTRAPQLHPAFPFLPTILLTACLLGIPARPSLAADWPRWRGPDLNGISKETGWTTQFPASGPKVLWKANVGTGFSSIAVANGRAYSMGNKADTDTVYCFDAETGKVLWRHAYPCELLDKYYEGGPGSTPTVDGDRVYTFSKTGELFCLDATGGKVIWSKNLARELGAKLPTWALAGSVLVEGDRLLLNLGDAGTAVDKQTGKVLWTSGKGPAGYATPVPFGSGDDRAVAIFGEKHVCAVRVQDGKELWRHPWKTSYEVNGADPIVLDARGERVFISSGYNRGCALLRIADGKPAVLWENKNMRNQFNPSVRIDGHIYGIDDDAGKNNTSLKCVDLETGAVRWSEPTRFGSLLAADGKLIVLNERGLLMIVEAAPGAAKVLARAQVLGGKCWTTPALANGRIYCRNAAGDLVCLDVKG